MTDGSAVVLAWQAGHDWAIDRLADAADDVDRVAPTPRRSYEQRVADRISEMESFDVATFMQQCRRRDDATRERVYAAAARYKPIDSWADMWPWLDEGTRQRIRDDYRDEQTGGWKPGAPDEVKEVTTSWRWAE